MENVAFDGYCISSANFQRTAVCGVCSQNRQFQSKLCIDFFKLYIILNITFVSENVLQINLFASHYLK